MGARAVKIRGEKFGSVVFDPRDRKYLLLLEPPSVVTPARVAGMLGRPAMEMGDLRLVGNGHGIAAPAQGLAAPLAAYIEIAGTCTLACSHCFKPERGYAHGLERSHLCGIIDQLEAAGVFELRFVGFEPTNSPHLAELSAYAREKDFYQVLNTNGFYGREMRETVCALGFDEVLVSVEGPEDVHDRIRGRGSYRSAVGLLEYLAAERVPARINMTVSGANIGCMGHIAELADALGLVAGFAPMRVLGAGCGMDLRARLSPMHMRQIALAVQDLRRVHPATKIILAYHDHFNDQSDTYHPLWLNDPCPAAKNVSILNNGQVFLCDFLAHIGDRFCGGNILEQPLMDIWRQAREFRRYRELPRAERCLNCDRLGTRCSGGCSAETLDHEDVFFDPLCFLRADSADTEAKAIGDGLDTKSRFYDLDYFLSGPETGKGNYRNYRWQPEKTLSEVDALISLWNARPRQVVIDFGAAYGFYVKAFGMRGLRAYGIDCSRHAIEEARKDPDIADRIFHSTSLTAAGIGMADWVLAKDVLEHLTLVELSRFLSEVNALGAGLAVVVPLARFDGGRYLSPQAEKDGGHNLRRSRQWWRSLLSRNFGKVEEPELPAAFATESNKGRIGLFIARPQPEDMPGRRKTLVMASKKAGPVLGVEEL